MKNTVKKSIIVGVLTLTLGGCAQTAKIPYVGAAFSKGSVAMQKVFGSEEGQLSFASGSAQINEERARETLAMFVSELSELPRGGVIKIAGHTDNKGVPHKNLKLSLKRAVAVKRVLVGMGVDESQIETVGLGDKEAIANNATADGRAMNRRVEITLIRS